MYLIRSHGIVHLRWSKPVSYRRWFFILPLTGTWVLWLEHLTVKIKAKKSLNVSALLILNNQAYVILTDRTHIFTGLSFLPTYLLKLFLLPLISQAIFKSDFCLPGQFLCIPPRLPVLASTLCRLSFWVCISPGTSCSSVQVVWRLFF